MTKVLDKTDLSRTANSFDGWETSVATSSGNMMLYTANWFAAYSTDRGNTFTPMDPNQICSQFGETFVSDQVVIYIPKVDVFAWVMLTTKNNLVVSFRTPDIIDSSSGTSWNSLLISASQIGGAPGDRLDYPEVAVGDNFLYLTIDIVGKGSVALRFPLTQVSVIARSMKSEAWWADYYSVLGIPALGLRPAQNTGSTGYFVGQKSNSELLVVQWPESGGAIIWPPLSVYSIPDTDWEVRVPDRRAANWLDSSNKPWIHITGLTRQYQYLWVAWTGARKVEGHSENDFSNPHIELAIIDTNKKSVREQHHIYHQNWAYAWPSLNTNKDNDVGMSYIWGGNDVPPQYAVTVLTDANGDYFWNEPVTVSSGNSIGGGGHYTSVRQDGSNPSYFCASGHNTVKYLYGEVINHPYYVLFMLDYYH